ncbi:MAG: ankyrin repeat domain-containing protein [Bacteroidia bacterium]
MKQLLTIIGISLVLIANGQNKRVLRQIIKTEDTVKLKALVEQGFDLNSNYNRTTCFLNHAILSDKYDLTKFILNQENVRIQRVQEDGFTTLHYIVHNGWYDLARKLINEGVDPNTLGYKKSHILRTVLFNYVATNTPDSTSLNFIKYLYDNGIDDQLSITCCSERTTILILSVAWADVSTIQYFLEKDNSYIDSTDPKGWTPLHMAIKKEKIEAMNYLISEGADLKVKNNNGQTPLDFALKTKNNELIQEIKTAYNSKHKK